MNLLIDAVTWQHQDCGAIGTLALAGSTGTMPCVGQHLDYYNIQLVGPDFNIRVYKNQKERENDMIRSMATSIIEVVDSPTDPYMLIVTSTGREKFHYIPKSFSDFAMVATYMQLFQQTINDQKLYRNLWGSTSYISYGNTPYHQKRDLYLENRQFFKKIGSQKSEIFMVLVKVEEGKISYLTDRELINEEKSENKISKSYNERWTLFKYSMRVHI